jgi:6-phosphogluconolactonase
VVLDDAGAIAVEAASRLTAALAQVLDGEGEAHLALTGGSSATALHLELRRPERLAALDWSRVHFWWGDERFVPLDHPESNAGTALRVLFGMGVGQTDASLVFPGRSGSIHPVPVDEALSTGAGPETAAASYAELLRSTVGSWTGDVPRLDVVLLGVGPDGHILSVFPGSPALSAEAPLAMGIEAPGHVAPHLARITLSPRILEAAGTILVMAPGASKADMVGHVLGRERDPARWPAQLAVRRNAAWLLDRESAALLR